HTRRSNCTDRVGDIIRPKTTRQNHRYPDKLDDTMAKLPVMRYPERSNLPIRFSMAIQEQEIGNSLVAASNSNARLAHYGDASHQKHAGQLAFEGCCILWPEQFGRCAQMDSRRSEAS